MLTLNRFLAAAAFFFTACFLIHSMTIAIHHFEIWDTLRMMMLLVLLSTLSLLLVLSIIKKLFSFCSFANSPSYSPCLPFCNFRSGYSEGNQPTAQSNCFPLLFSSLPMWRMASWLMLWSASLKEKQTSSWENYDHACNMEQLTCCIIFNLCVVILWISRISRVNSWKISSAASRRFLGILFSWS